jgi:hypothetical protein
MPRCSASISALKSLENHVFGMSMPAVVSITVLCSVSTSVIPVLLYTGRCHRLPAAIQPTTCADVLRSFVKLHQTSSITCGCKNRRSHRPAKEQPIGWSSCCVQ